MFPRVFESDNNKLAHREAYIYIYIKKKAAIESIVKIVVEFNYNKRTH